MDLKTKIDKYNILVSKSSHQLPIENVLLSKTLVVAIGVKLTTIGVLLVNDPLLNIWDTFKVK